MPRPKRPTIARKAVLPQSRQAKLDLSKRLSRKVNEVCGHLGTNPHDYRSRLVLERILGQRAEVLAALKEQKPDLDAAALKEVLDE